MAFTMAMAVQKICIKVGDAGYETYCTDTETSGYDGRAKDAFWEGVIDILADMYKDKKHDEKEEGKTPSSIFSDEDIKGLITLSSEPINSATGKILYADISNYFKLKDMYPNPDGSNQLSVFLKKTNINYFKGIMGEDFVPDDTIYWYPIGDGIIFYPKADTKYVDGEDTLEYTEELDFAEADPDTITGTTNFETAGFEAGDYVYVDGTDENDGIYEIAGVAAEVITLVTTAELTAETITATIGKCRELTIVYITEPQISDYDYTSSGDAKPLTSLFSLTFIYKAIELASQKIETEKVQI